NRLLGKSGFGYFNTAYDIYAVLLMVSTTGLPVAMSRMISESRTLGRTRQIRQIYRVSLLVFLIIGLAGAGGMAILCHQLSSVMSQKESWFAILCLSPAVLFISLISADRGFFQGQSNMMPTSISQVLEALVKLVVGLIAAWIFKKQTGSMIYAAGGAILGVTASTVASYLYLVQKRRRAMAELDTEFCEDETVLSRKQTARQLLSIAVPISLGAAGMQLIIAIDGAVYMARLKGAAGFATKMANDMKGIYNFCQTIFNMPCAFITPLTISVIPAITEQLTRRASRVANTVAESAIRVTSLIAMPCSVGLIVLAEPIMGFLGHYAGADLVLATKLMRILGVCVGINSLVLIVTAILQAHGYVYLPVLNLAIGGIVKIIVNFVLVGNPKINIVGAPLGTLACYLLISGLDVFAMKRVLRRPPALLRNVWKSAVAAVLMGAVAWLVNRVLAGAGLSAAIRAAGAILVAVVVYAVMVLIMKVITADDCKLLPKGDKIAKILKIS
ncbi:MAG: polysaccharide biosynthesis protein, partial [Oscillospiraceae bacterium]|nr:polysaccharide biosynthesis protein [Oscillospiraceae bacterium]